MDASIDPVAGIEWLAGLFPVRPPRRRPLTVMFTDIAGFTAYAAARIAERALGGEILVSDAVRSAANGLAARFRPVRALVIAGREPRPLFRAQATTMSAACQTASKARCTETA